MAKFGGVDFIDFDSQLNDEEKLVRQTAREFVENEIIPIIEKHSREATFPKHLIPQLGELGFFGANLHGYGCAGMSNVAYGLMTQELERGDSGVRSFVSVQSALVMYPIYAFGSDEQKNKWLPLLQQGKKIGCFGLTEPQFGSNPGGMLTRAVKKGSKYVLNGEKMWITSGSIADIAVVWAKCEDEKIRGFLVEKGTPGFKAWDVHGKWSLRASVTSGLSFGDCEIPGENLLPGVVGLKGPLSCLNQARYGIGWGALGAAMACYDTALQYAKTRKQFANKPIASHQLVGKIGMDDYRNRKRPIAGVARGKNQRPRQSRSVAHLHAENEQCRYRAGNCAQVARHPRRQRHRGRLLHHAPHEQPRKRFHLRRHQRHPQTGDRRKNHRHRRLRLGFPNLSRKRLGPPFGVRQPGCRFFRPSETPEAKRQLTRAKGESCKL
jgi:glutaryl-CoA dehydrogenase